MALVALEIPKVGLVMESARLVRWLKNVGEAVKQGEPLLEVETEKSVVEIESTESGRLVELLLQVDQEARVGDRIAWLENDVWERQGCRRYPGRPQRRCRRYRASLPAPQPRHRCRSTIREELKITSRESGSPHGRIRSSPVARRLAAQHAVDSGRLPERAARTCAADRRAAGHRGTVSPRSGTCAPGIQRFGMRRALARSMTLSNATVPQFVVERAVDWTALKAVRAKVVAELPAGAPKPSVNDFLLQGIARTLLSFPALNATFSGDADSPDAGLVMARGAHIGLVVAVEDGLLVPVLHDVEQLGLAELARRRSEAVARALKGKLKREELEGARSASQTSARGGWIAYRPHQSAAIGILAVGRQRTACRHQWQHSGEADVPAHAHRGSPRCRRPAGSGFPRLLVEIWKATRGGTDRETQCTACSTARIVLDPCRRADPLGEQAASMTSACASRPLPGRIHRHGLLAHRYHRGPKKYSFREMKQILDDNGITQIEVEWLWTGSAPASAGRFRIRPALLRLLPRRSARHIKIGDLGNDCAEVPLMAEEFGLLCRQAAERGTNVLFEMLPAVFSRAPSLDQVLAICRGSGAKNGGIMLDNLHLQRTATPPEDIVRKIGRDIPLGVEINDGTLAMPVNLPDSVVSKRLLPGGREFDIAAFLGAVWTQGYSGPVGVEVLNEYIPSGPWKPQPRKPLRKRRESSRRRAEMGSRPGGTPMSAQARTTLPGEYRRRADCRRSPVS